MKVRNELEGIFDPIRSIFYSKAELTESDWRIIFFIKLL